MKETLIRMLAALTIAIFCSCMVSGQEGSRKVPECENTSREGIDYKVFYADRGIREPYTLGLRIVVRKKQIIDRDFMLKLAESLRRRYCHDDNIGATVFDDKKVAKSADAIVDQLTGKRRIPEIRGFYSFDRTKDIEKVSFSSRRGNAPDEIVVDLRSNE